ncbi:MAG TPA: DUF2254 family protein [Candidatus Methanoperedens sp.]
MKINESYKPILKNWLYGLAFYLIPSIIGYLAFRSILSDTVMQTDVESARAFLGALITSEASILAIVVSLSLVAVQLAAQSYSARVIDVFRRTPDLWILMGIYGIAMFWGLGVLKMIERAETQLCTKEYICYSNFEGYTAGAYYLGIFAFMALVPYFWKTFELLKHSTMINMLAEGITKDNILKSIDKKSEKLVAEDPIQPIVDIVIGSIIKYDYETARFGLKAIGEHISRLLKNAILTEDDATKISKRVLFHFDNIGRLALSKESVFTWELLTNFKKIINTYAERNLDIVWEMIFHFGELGIKAANKNLDDETCWIAIDLGDIGEVAAKNNLPKACLQTVRHLGKLGKEAIEKELLEAASFAASSLYKVGTAGAHLQGVAKESIESLKLILKACPIDKKYEDVIRNIIESIRMIGIASAENNLDYIIFDTIEFLGKMGKEVSEKNLDVAASETSKSLQLIARASPNHQLKWYVIEAQSEIGKISANLGLNATCEAVISIGSLGIEVSEDKKLKALEFLKEIGLSACKHGSVFETANRNLIDALFSIGREAIVTEEENERVTLKAISYIEEVGKACKHNPDSVTRHAKQMLGEFTELKDRDGKTIKVSRQILNKVNQSLNRL